MTVDETVMVAGLVRALARACHDDWSPGRPVEPVRPELLRAAKWQASRFGLEGSLIDVRARRAVPAPDVVDALSAIVRPWLEEAGDWDEVGTLVRETLNRGTGARRQREALARHRPDGRRRRPDRERDRAGCGLNRPATRADTERALDADARRASPPASLASSLASALGHESPARRDASRAA